MIITRDMRRQAAETATEAQLYLYGSVEAAEQLGAILDEAGITDMSIRSQIIEQVANIALGFYKPEQIDDLIGNLITYSSFTTLKHKLSEFLQPLQIDSQAEEIRTVVNPEIVTSAPPHIRTMSQDIAVNQQNGEEPVYRSSQDALLAEQIELADALARVADRPLSTQNLTPATNQPASASANNQMQPSTPTAIPIKRASESPRWESEVDS